MRIKLIMLLLASHSIVHGQSSQAVSNKIDAFTYWQLLILLSKLPKLC
jgi:hypothetical protein